MNFSIIIPVFNRSHLIKETIQSLLNQTYNSFECIIVDDGSDDKTKQVVKNTIKNDSRFIFIERHRDPKGAPTCRNIGIDIASNDYLIFLDSDDLLTTYSLEQRSRLISEYPGFDCYVFNCAPFYDDVKRLKGTLYNVDNEKPYLERYLLEDSVWQTAGAVINKKIASQIRFDEDMASLQDNLFYIRLLSKHVNIKSFLNIIPDILFRIHSDNRVSNRTDMAVRKLFFKKIFEMKCSSSDYIIQDTILRMKIRYIKTFLTTNFIDAFNTLSKHKISKALIFNILVSSILEKILLKLLKKKLNINVLLQKEYSELSRNYIDDRLVSKIPLQKEFAQQLKDELNYFNDN